MSKSKRKFKRPQLPQSQSEAMTGDELGAADDNAANEAAKASSQSAGSAGSSSSSNKVVKPTYSTVSTGEKIVGSLLGIKREESRVQIDLNVPHSYKRPLWKHIIRYPAAFFLILLNVAIVMSFIERLPQHRVMDPFREAFFFGMVGFIDIFMFLPILLEVNKLETDNSGIRIGALLWRAKLTWEQITSFEQPKYLKFAILKTKKGMYFLNKYDLKPFYEVAEIISAKMKPTIQDRQG